MNKESHNLIRGPVKLKGFCMWATIW